MKLRRRLAIPADSGGLAMPEVRLDGPTDFEGWREAARTLIAAGTPPEAVAWRVGGEGREPGLPLDGPPPRPETGSAAAAAAAAAPAPAPAPELRVPLRFLLLARRAALHADPGRFALLYRLLWRLCRGRDRGDGGGGERRLLERLTDGDVARLLVMTRAVEREARRMEAGLCFEEVWTRTGPHRRAWFAPEHYVLELCADSLARRFSTGRWTIITPYRSATWDGGALLYGPGGDRPLAVAEPAEGRRAGIPDPAALAVA